MYNRLRDLLLCCLLVAGALIVASAEQRAAGAGPAVRNLPGAPAVGEPLPDFTSVDQHGEKVSFHQLRRGRKAYLLIVRSASW